MPSPTRMPKPPALRYAWCTPEMPLITPAKPTVSSGRPQDFPASARPAAAVLSISLNSYGSILPSANPARGNTPRSAVTCCSRLKLTPPRLAYWRTAEVAGTPPDAAATQKSGDRDFARLAPQVVAALDFADPLELRKMRVELDIVGHGRQIEYAAAHRPVALVPLGGGAVSKTPGIGGVVERAGVDQRPIHEIAARIVGVFVGVENVGDAEFTDGEHQAVRRLRAAELVGRSIHLFRIAAEIDGLADEILGNSRIGHRGADLVGLAARESGDAQRRAQAETLIDLRIDPKLGALPQAHADKRGGVPGLAALVGREAVLAGIGVAEREDILTDIRGLAVDGEIVELRHRRRDGGAPRAWIAVEPVVEAEAQFADVEIRVETLRAGRERHAAVAVIGEQIFEPRGPVRRQSKLHAGAGDATYAWHHEQILHLPRYRGAAGRRAGDLRAAELVVAPSEAAGGVE